MPSPIPISRTRPTCSAMICLSLPDDAILLPVVCAQLNRNASRPASLHLDIPVRTAMHVQMFHVEHYFNLRTRARRDTH